MKLKKLLALLLALTMIVVLAAGGGGSKTTETPAAETPATETPAAETPSAGDTANLETRDFIVQCWDPASSVCAMFVEVLGGIMNEKSDGRMTFTYYHGGSLVGAKDTWDAIQNGVCDMAWGACSPFAGVFPISEGVALPFNGVTADVWALLFIWDLYNMYQPLRDEYSTVHMVALGANTTAPLSLTGSKAETPADLEGRMIRVPNSVVALWCKTLGMVPQTIAPPETYEALEKNVVNGCTCDWHFINAFSLPEVLNNICDVPTCHSPLWFLVNQDVYDGLPDDMKAIVDELSENGFAAELMGEAWDYTRSWVIDQCVEKGIEVYQPTDELRAAMVAAAEVTFTDYKAYCDGLGQNGEEIFTKYASLINHYADQYADPWTDYESTFVAYKDKYYKGVSAK
jgi:TRAP-type C4-dicarboxylate transport system substrate-binding protein